MNRANPAVSCGKARAGKLPTLLLIAALAGTSIGSGCSGGPNGSSANREGPSDTSAPAPGEAAAPPGSTAAPPGSTPTPAPFVPSPHANRSPPLRLSAARGIYLLDPPLAGEALFEGEVEVVVDGKAPPADTVVELNGVPLARETRNDDADRFWRVDPAHEPPLGAGGTVTLTARSGSLTGGITLSCPDDLAVASSTPPGTSLSGVTALVLGWGSALSVNTVTRPYASLRGLDVASSAASPVLLAHRLLPRGSVETALPVEATTATGYAAEVRWQGPYQREGNSDGFCGRAKRLVYLN